MLQSAMPYGCGCREADVALRAVLTVALVARRGACVQWPAVILSLRASDAQSLLELERTKHSGSVGRSDLPQ
jgi:hypothetical protein